MSLWHKRDGGQQHIVSPDLRFKPRISSDVGRVGGQDRQHSLLLCSGGRSGNLEVSLTVLTFKLTTLLFPFALAANILT